MYTFLLILLILDALLLSRRGPAAGRTGRRTRLARRRRAPSRCWVAVRPSTILTKAHLVVRRDLPGALAAALGDAPRSRGASELQQQLRQSAPPTSQSPHRAVATAGPDAGAGARRRPVQRRRADGARPGRQLRLAPAAARRDLRSGAPRCDGSSRLRPARGRNLVSPARRRVPSTPTFGEVVFTTNLTGYQETFTDPSYLGPDRRDDRADDRQLRRQLRGHGVGRAAGERGRGAGALATATPTGARNWALGRMACASRASRSSRTSTPAGSRGTSGSAGRCAA